MEEKKKKSPKAHLGQPVPTSALRKLPVPASKSASFSLGMPHLPSPKQRAKFKRATKEAPRGVPQLGGNAGSVVGTPLQHSFLTDVSDVYEMEGGLLNLLNDFHSGKLQAFDLLSLTTWRPEPPLHSSTHDETATKQQTDKQRSVPVRLVRLRGSKDSSPERFSSTSLWLRSYSQTAAI